MEEQAKVFESISPVSFHYGPLTGGSRTYRIAVCLRDHPNLGGPFVAVEVLGVGYYAGWFDLKLWEWLKKENIVKPQVGPPEEP